MTSVDTDRTLLEFDRKHIWHPYTSMTDPLTVFPVSSAKGVHLQLVDGTKLIDGMSSWWAAIHGYNHPTLNKALEEQLCDMAHVMFGGITHKSAVDLARMLVKITPAPLEKVFFCDSGSVAVEVAIKMALQYWFAQGKTDKQKLVTLKGGYHGDTFGAMAVCDPITGMHHLFSGVLPQHFFVPSPPCGFHDPWQDRYSDPLENILAKYHSQIAALILEPIVQGAGGMRFYSPFYLEKARKLCDQYNVLLIADEIATGFGRSGTLFACNRADISPDIICLGKALTGGYLTMAATVTTEEIGAGISRNGGVFMHGPTFMANPLACAVASASVKLLLESDWQKRLKNIETQLDRDLALAAGFNHVTDVRVLGAIGVIELSAPVNLDNVQKAFVKRGVWIRPFGRLLYTMPSYIITKAELSVITTAMLEVIAIPEILF
jgi:adenosylmethionine-8-amino-7-oxononanoate aminotransferase